MSGLAPVFLRCTCSAGFGLHQVRPASQCLIYQVRPASQCFISSWHKSRRWYATSSKPVRYDLKALLIKNYENKMIYGPVITKSVNKKKSNNKKGRIINNDGKYISGNDGIDLEIVGNVNDGSRQYTSSPLSDVTVHEDDISLEPSSECEAAVHEAIENKPGVGQSPLDSVLHWTLQSEPNKDIQNFKDFVEDLSPKYLPSVNYILKKTQSPENKALLDRWKAKMMAKLGEEGFEKMQAETLRNGTNLHACIQKYLSGALLSDIQIPPEIDGHWRSFQGFLPEVSDVRAQEVTTSHPGLFYKGIFDCIATYRGKLCLIDWKTSSKPKPLLSSTYDNPLQVAAYMGAVNSDPAFDLEVSDALIVVVYPDGQPPHSHYMSPQICDFYWRLWLQRLHAYWKMVAEEHHGNKI